MFNDLFSLLNQLEIPENNTALPIKIANLKKEVKNMQNRCSVFEELLNSYSKTYSLDTLGNVKQAFYEVEKSLRKCSILTTNIASAFPDEKFFEEFKRREMFLIQKDNALGRPLQIQIQNLIKADYALLKSAKRGQTIKSLFKSLNRRRISRKNP